MLLIHAASAYTKDISAYVRFAPPTGFILSRPAITDQRNRKCNHGGRRIAGSALGADTHTASDSSEDPIVVDDEDDDRVERGLRFSGVGRCVHTHGDVC